ncbi:MAG: GNAT family protein [Nocardioides sp.]
MLMRTKAGRLGSRGDPGRRNTSVHRLEVKTQPDNVAEQRALLAVGFQQEGVLRGAEFRDGT